MIGVCTTAECINQIAGECGYYRNLMLGMLLRLLVTGLEVFLLSSGYVAYSEPWQFSMHMLLTHA